MSLSAEQIGFFKSNGYLLVPAAMDVNLCARARDMMWQSLPAENILDRHEPSSHVGPFPEAHRSSESLHSREGYRWLNREVGVSETLISLVYSEAICGMAERLLGGPLRQAVVDGTPMGSRGPAWPGGPTDPALGNEGARGIYFTLPSVGSAREPDSCHTDGHPFQLSVVGLLDEVPKDGGAFKIWPGSHSRLYPTFQLRYDQPRIPYYDHLPSLKGIVHTPEYLAEIDQLNADTQAVECWGSVGDIVFWHHRTAHMAGHNYSDVIRKAVLADFWRTDFDQLRLAPAQGDMWQDWSQAIQGSDGVYTAAFAETQRLTSNRIGH